MVQPMVKKPEGRVTLQSAVAHYLSDIDLAIAARNKRPASRVLTANTLKRFSEFLPSEVQYLSQITPAHLSKYAAHVLEKSPTRSTETARNHFLRVLQFLKSRGVTLYKRDGE